MEVLWHGAPCRPRSPRPLSKQTVRCPALYLSPERRIVLSTQRNCETVHHSKEREDREEKERVFKDPSKKGSGSKKAILGGVGSSKTRDLLCYHAIVCSTCWPALPLASICVSVSGGDQTSLRHVTKSASRDQVCVSPLSFLSTSVLDPALPFCSS